MARRIFSDHADCCGCSAWAGRLAGGTASGLAVGLGGAFVFMGLLVSSAMVGIVRGGRRPAGEYRPGPAATATLTATLRRFGLDSTGSRENARLQLRPLRA